MALGSLSKSGQGLLASAWGLYPVQALHLPGCKPRGRWLHQAPAFSSSAEWGDSQSQLPEPVAVGSKE